MSLGFLNALIAVAGLRGLEEVIEREANKVPVIIDILENKVLGREYKRGLGEGLEKGLERGRKQANKALLSRLIEERFGPIPAAIDQRLRRASSEQLETWAVDLLKAKSLKQLFKN
jgi:hypothetical protein